METDAKKRTAKEKGWRHSRYNLSMPDPDGNGYIIANLFSGSCKVYSLFECYLLSVFEGLDEHHPILPYFAKEGLIVNFDELSAIEARNRLCAGYSEIVSLTICPTMGCNFDCPYCFEKHGQGKMDAETQNQVVQLARSMLSISRAKRLSVSWFGGEPLLYPEIIDNLSKKLITLAEEFKVDYDSAITTNGYFLTEDNIKMLDRAGVSCASITLDGIGHTHDRTRHLINGDGSFSVITGNLRNHIPFKVCIRHNVSDENAEEYKKLKKYIDDLAAETGNRLTYSAALVRNNPAATDRGADVRLLHGELEIEIEARWRLNRIAKVMYCGAQSLWNIGIDDKGRLYKCWEIMSRPEYSFGTAERWNPANPIQSADKPDRLTDFINAGPPIYKDECRSCIWLPHCMGGCPYCALYTERSCPSYKDNPEAFLLAKYKELYNKL